MTHSQSAKCPFSTSIQSKPLSSHPYSVQFEDPPQTNWIQKIGDFIEDRSSRIGYSSLRNVWRTYKTGDLNEVFSRVCKPHELISDFHTPIGTQYIIKDHAILKLVLSKFRNEEKGLFAVPENEKIFINCIVKKLYPNEVGGVTDRERELINAMLITAESSHIPFLRSHMSFLKNSCIQEYREELDKIARNILDKLSPEEKKACNPSQLVFEYAITVICRLITGYEASRQEYQKIVKAMVTFGKYISGFITHHSPSAQDKIDYEEAFQTMRELIELNLHATPLPPFTKGLKEGGFSDISIKIYLFFLYLAGVETTAAVTHYLLLQLSLSENQTYQDAIRNEGANSLLLKKCITEALRLNPSVFIMGRALRHDILVTLRDSNQTLIWSKRLRKGHYIVNWIGGAGRDPNVFADPNLFNPQRFDNNPTQLPWLPFATGHHTCPGQFLAKAEMESLISQILMRFHIQALPFSGNIETKGVFTLHADPHEKIKIRLIPVI